MKKFLFLLTFIVGITFSAYADGPEWQYLGKVNLTKPQYNNQWQEVSASGLLYGQFDGEKMNFKVYISEENQAYRVVENLRYDKDKVDYETKMDNRHDNWKGPRPSIPERYPQKAGEYYFDVANVIK